MERGRGVMTTLEAHKEAEKLWNEVKRLLSEDTTDAKLVMTLLTQAYVYERMCAFFTSPTNQPAHAMHCAYAAELGILVGDYSKAWAWASQGLRNEHCPEKWRPRLRELVNRAMQETLIAGTKGTK